MASSSANKKIWALLIVFLLLLVGASFLAGAREAKEYPAYVSYSPAPSGVQALYTYLERETGSVENWFQAPAQLPAATGLTLVMVEPAFLPSEPEMENYIEFIEAGNTILLFQEDPDGMFGLETAFEETFTGETVALNDQENNEYQAVVDSFVRIDTEPGDEVLFEDAGGVLAVKRAIGAGELIAVSASNWVVNDMILEENHIPLVLSLFAEAGITNGILFDEYIHGGENAPTYTDLYPAWLIVFAIQAILIMVLWLWHQGKRFGPVIIPREETVRYSDERIQALAAWYQRGGLYSESLAIQADYLKLLLQERWNLSYNLSWKETTVCMKQRNSRLSNQEITSFGEEITTILEKDRLNKQEYLQWSKTIDRLREEVEQR